MRLIKLLMLFLFTGSAFAQQPLRVAIVGLEHGHVGGFLKQFPNQHEVELVVLAALEEKRLPGTAGLVLGLAALATLIEATSLARLGRCAKAKGRRGKGEYASLA